MHRWLGSAFVLLSVGCMGTSAGISSNGGSGGSSANSGGGFNTTGSGAGGPLPPPEDGGAGGAADGVGGEGGSLAAQNPMCPANGTQTYYLSPDDSGSMASPAYARELLRAGILPPASSIRPWEWMNFYHFDYPEPIAPKRVAIHAEVAELIPKQRWELTIAVRAQTEVRPQVGMTFVVDTSASMAGPGIARARSAVVAMISELQTGDVVNVVRWSSDAQPLAAGVVLDDASKVNFANQVAADLAPFGGSDLTGGLQAGYALAAEHFVAGGHNRVVLVSDGGASPSAYDLEQITKGLGAADESAIFLTGVGVGPAEGYNDTLMDLVTDAARGSYAYVDAPDRAPVVLADRFDELMFVTEPVIGVRVELPGYLVIDSTSAEQISQDPNLVKDQHIAPGDTIVLRQEIALAPGCTENVIGSPDFPPDILATVTSGKGVGASDLDTISTLVNPVGASVNALKARALFAVTEALKKQDVAALQASLALLDDALLANPSDLEIDDLIQTLNAYLP